MTGPTPLLAFGWTSLPMLGWLAVAAAPVVIHLLSRRRYRRRDWAAMQFLAAALRESRRRLRIENLLLLLVRTLIIVLVVLAVADPYVESSGLLFAPGGVRTHRVLVLDGSYSMGYIGGQRSRFDEAKELAARIVRASPQGDGFSLVVMGRPPRVLVDVAALAPAEFLRELEAARRTDGTADLAATLAKVDSVLRGTRRERPGLEQQEIYFLTDLCRVGWMGPRGDAVVGEARRRAKDLARRARIVVVDLGRPGADNSAVTRLATADSYVTLAGGAEIEVTLHNFGPRVRKGQTVELLVDARRVARRTVDLSSGKSRVVRFAYRFDVPGEHVVEARLAVDRLAVDNRRWLVLPVRRALDVLCVDGRPGGNFSGATAYLNVALAPGDGESSMASVCPRVVPESALVEVDLSRYACVFLCDVAQVTATEARVLGEYVRGGGGLVVFLGRRVMAERYNRELVEREPLLPGFLQGVVENTQPGLDPLGYAHPIVEPFRGREQAGLVTTPVERYVKVVLPVDSKARVALATRGGDPLIVEQSVGRGRVVLVTTSADTSWTAMPLWPSYVPIVQEIVAWAVAGGIVQHNVLVGEPLAGSLPASAAGEATHVVLPDGHEEVVAVGGPRGRAWRFDATGPSGIYTIRLGGAAADESRFAVNVDTVESNLEKLTEEQLCAEVWPGVSFDYRTTWEASGRRASATIGRRGGLARWLLWVALGLLVAETFLGRRFGHYETAEENYGATDAHR